MTDESGSDASPLLSALRAALLRVVSAIRAFGATLPVQAGKPKTEAPRFGDYEKVEEAKYHSPALRSLAGDRNLPEWSGRPGVTLLAVDPYLIYVYWDFDLARLPPDTTAAALRFYDVASHFDVDVDLRTGNWYVPVWSPAKTYFADLGAITAAGEFIPLLRSNTIQTSRAWPVAEVERRFVPAAAPRESNEPVPSQTQPLGSERAGIAEITLRADGPPTIADLPATAAGPASSLNIAESPAGEARPAVTFSPATGHRPPRSVVSVPPAEQPKPAEQNVPKPANAADILRKRLSEIYEYRQWEPEAQGPAVATPRAIPPLPAAPDLPEDLTANAEHQFSPGLSSLLLGQRPLKPAD